MTVVLVLILFEDEVIFRQEPTLHQTWARMGHQPEIPTTGQRKKNFFGAISLYYANFTYYESEVFNSDNYVTFLEHLIEESSENKLLLIQDNAKYHKSEKVNSWLSENSNKILAYYLPPYSPEFNAIEKIWRRVRKNNTHNRYFINENELLSTVVGASGSIQNNPQQVYGYLRSFY